MFDVFVATKLVVTNIVLSEKAYFCRDKRVKRVFCRDKSCHEKIMLVATSFATKITLVAAPANDSKVSFQAQIIPPLFHFLTTNTNYKCPDLKPK